MKQKALVVITSVLLSVSAVWAEVSIDSGVSDASVNRSSEMNQAVGYAASAGGGELRVLFLGNSITLHAPAPKIGWTNAWGMAASAAERDYVHLVTRGIEAKTGRKARVLVKNIADFERGYRGWCPGDHLKKEAAFDPDYLIVAVGENVPTFQYEQDKADYREAFDRLLGFFIRNRHVRPNAVVRGVFWRNDARDALVADVASDLAVPFVKTDFAEESGMKAGAAFWHKGVANHPGDKGMAETARRILEALFPSETDFAVTVGGQSVKVRPIRISAMPYNQWAPNYQRPVNQTETAACVTIEAEGATEVRVRTTARSRSRTSGRKGACFRAAGGGRARSAPRRWHRTTGTCFSKTEKCLVRRAKLG